MPSISGNIERWYPWLGLFPGGLVASFVYANVTCPEPLKWFLLGGSFVLSVVLAHKLISLDVRIWKLRNTPVMLRLQQIKSAYTKKSMYRHLRDYSRDAIVSSACLMGVLVGYIAHEALPRPSGIAQFVFSLGGSFAGFLGLALLRLYSPARQIKEIQL